MSTVSAFFGNLVSFLKIVSPLIFLIGGSILIALGYGWLLEDFIVSDMLYVYAAIPTLFTMIGLGKILYSFGPKRIERKAIRLGLSGHPPKDGELFAFIGTLEADEDILTSPFSGQDCVLYEYSLTETVHHSGRRGSDSITTEVRFSGFHLCPCHINTTTGPVALHAYPMATNTVASQGMANPVQSARTFVENTRFKDAHGLKYITQTGEIAGQLMKDVIPPVVIDVAFTTNRDIDSLDINEEYLPPGNEVFLLARYDARQKAAVAGHFGAKMSAHDHDRMRERARGSWVRSLAWGLFFAAVGLGIGILPLAPSGVLEELGSPGQSMLEQRQGRVRWVEHYGAMPLAWHLVSIFEPDTRDENGWTLLMASIDPGMSRLLLERGADPNAVNKRGETVLHHSYTLEVAKVLLEYGADASSRDDGKTAEKFFAALDALDVRGVSLFLQNGWPSGYFSLEDGFSLQIVVSKCGDDREDRVAEIARMLVENVGKDEVRNAGGLEALETARRQCGREVVSVLEGAVN